MTVSPWCAGRACALAPGAVPGGCQGQPGPCPQAQEEKGEKEEKRRGNLLHSLAY